MALRLVQAREVRAGRGPGQRDEGSSPFGDSGNPNASPSGLWVGLVEQPHTIKGYYDFQKWLRPYQFFARTDADGNFTIPNVLPGANYTLWAYGPGAAGTFLSQEQSRRVIRRSSSTCRRNRSP